MQLTVRDVAEMFRVGENVVYRWVSEEDMPAEQVNGQYRFNRTELLEWATVRRKEMSPRLFRNGTAPARLDEALELGGIHYHVGGRDRESVLRAVVERLPVPAEVGADYLLEILLSRESVGATAIGDGLALPHPRYPVVLPVPKPFIGLCFLDQPITYGKEPVHTLFCLVCPTVHVHLGLLARLGHALRDAEFRALVRQQAPAETILKDARRVEGLLEVSGSVAGK